MDNDASFYSLYYSKGVLEPLNLEVFGAKSYVEFIARYTPGGLDAATFEGKVYALPYQGNSMSLFINNKEFARGWTGPEKGRAQNVARCNSPGTQAEDRPGQPHRAEGVRLSLS
jgi:ABC-type glycerol-3-phosphate transport system substrate-binding protein